MKFLLTATALIVCTIIFAQPTLLIKNATIVDVEKGKLIPNQQVLISNGFISSISPAKKQIKADSVIDGKGMYLIPGLWDFHTHIWNDATTFPLLIANGITGVRGMFEDVKNVKKWRENISAGKYAGPSIFSAGPIVDGPKPVWPGSVAIANAEQGKKAVDSLKNKLKVDFIKVYSLLGREGYFAIAEACKQQNIPFAGHVPNVLTVLEAANAGQSTQEHLYGFIEAASDSSEKWFAYQRGEIKDTNWKIRTVRKEFLFRTFNEKKLQTILQQIKKTNTWICPTLTVNRGIAYVNDTSLLNDPRMAYMGSLTRNMWDYRKDFRLQSLTSKDFEDNRYEFELKLKITGMIHKAGIPLLAGTDFPNPHCYIGFSLHDELEWMVKAGLSPAEALQTATVNPAKYLNRFATEGSVAVNKKANLVLLVANPLQNISNTKQIQMVFLNGKVFNAEQLQQMLESVKKLVTSVPQQPSSTGFHFDEE
ncbi:MAG: amidohydrolase family protein [Chitinophagaceae bacterium]|nr:amidohydrolase family protein [Chitinophagaceae bacterium]